jgi:hypothetical protein
MKAQVCMSYSANLDWVTRTFVIRYIGCARLHFLSMKPYLLDANAIPISSESDSISIVSPVFGRHFQIAE